MASPRFPFHTAEAPLLPNGTEAGAKRGQCCQGVSPDSGAVGKPLGAQSLLTRSMPLHLSDEVAQFWQNQSGRA